MKQVKILEVTPRDGAYVINNQFRPHDMASIAQGLEEAGINDIEIGGHGCGLGASPKYGLAFATDEEYLQAVTAVLKNVTLNAFIIPDVGTKKEIDLAVKYGVKILRVGVNVDTVERSKEFLAYAKDCNLGTTINFMKTPLVSAKECAKNAEIAYSYGADTIYIVDSSGGMLPETVKEYIQAVKDIIDAPLGFHGHNNLMLAMADTLAAIEEGVSIVDSTLQGMGRSGGNCQTEVLVAILDKMGYATGIDLGKLLEVGEHRVKPLMARPQGMDDIAILLGYTDLHSSFLNQIDKYCSEKNITLQSALLKFKNKKILRIDRETIEKIIG